MSTITLPARAGTLRTVAAARPTRTVLALTMAWAAIAVGLGTGLQALRPGTGGELAALVATAGLTVFAVVVLANWGGPGRLGLVGPRRWRSPVWLLLPVAVCIFPVLGGFEPVSTGTLALLVAGYAMTGFAEEAVWRGVVLQALLPTGVWRAVLLSSALFGAVHLGNLAYRDSAFLVLLQVWGAFCAGVGYAALRLRTGALWPLMITHAFGDLLPRICGLHGLGVYVVHDAVLLLAGLWLLRGARGNTVTA